MQMWWIVTIISVIFVTYDVAQNKKMSEEKKALWIILTVLTGIIGAGIYYFVVKHQRTRKK